MSFLLHYDPKVYLVGRQEINEADLERFLREEGVEGWSTDTEEAGQILAEISGRLCYKSYTRPRPGGNAAYMGRILAEGHGSVLENCVFNFIITGVSRSFSHELVRHRAGFGYSQRSQRYCDEADGAFVVPEDYREEVESAVAALEAEWGENWRDSPGKCIREMMARPFLSGGVDIGLRWLRSMIRSQEDYAIFSEYGMAKFAGIEDKTARRKRARSAARSVLPNATETQLFVTANARALRGAIEQRCSKGADREIRKVFCAIWEILAREAPNIFGDYRKVDLGGGDFSLDTDYRKV